MTNLNFPSSPVNGQTYTSGNTTWTYRSDFGVWDITSSGPTGYTGSLGYSGSRGALEPWSVKTSTYTAIDGDRILADTSGDAPWGGGGGGGSFVWIDGQITPLIVAGGGGGGYSGGGSDGWS